MLVSVDFELLVQHPSHKKTAKTVFEKLLHWGHSNSSVELLALVKTNHHPSAIEKLEEFLVNASWHGRYTLKRWAPLAETRKNQRINRELMLHHAKWYGAEAHIDIATWPFEIQSKNPHGILLVSNEWPLSKRERIKTKLRASVLVERFHKYSAVALCKGCRASELLTENVQNQHTPENLMHALAVATREREKDTRSLSLAWVSPIPPQKTGIAGYSELLLHELSKHYNLTVITDTPSTCIPAGDEGMPIMSTKWLLKNASRFDRICYHIGNSPFHQTILTCLQQWPGAVVMHETSLGDLIYSYESGVSEVNKKWLITLYACHGYQPLLEANKEQGVPINTIQAYPCITQVVDRSLGTIVHSEITSRQIQSHFGDNSSHLSCCVPMCTKNRNLRTKEDAKTRLGFDKNTILICTFGMVGKAKLSLEIAEAWSRSTTKSRFSSQLVYVGENQPGSYGQSLSHRINQEDIKNQTKICGWINDELYEEYLAAADLALQFRTINRGETSAAIFDVVCSGVTTIINSRATISDLEASYMKITSEYPTVEEIATEIDVAIAEIVANKNDQLKEAESLRLKYSPEVCALKYRENIEVIYKSRKSVRDSVISWAANAVKQRSISAEQAAHIIRRDFNLNHPKKKQLFVDVSQIARSDYKTGIQRVVRSLVLQFIQLGIEGYHVEPVWLVSRPDGWHYRYARAWTMQTIGYQEQLLEDACIDANDGDILLVADLTGGYFIEADRCGVYDQLIQSGVTITAIVYDILPIQFPRYFPEGANDAHEKWLRCISARANSLVCISKAVADEVESWLRENQTDKPQDQQISWFHLGADLDNSAPTEGLPTNIDDLNSSIENNISFLMVGTVEPRKGHQQTLEAFQILHERGCNVSLVIVGKRGWMVNQLIDKMMNASTSEKDIFWYENASDEFLNWLYMHCNCLLAASEGEGFGLPLIEAARHNLPLLVRDIPVFREVAGSAAYYFKAANKTELADSVQDWCVLYQTNNIPKPDDLKYIEWKQSAMQLIDVIGLKVENRQ